MPAILAEVRPGHHDGRELGVHWLKNDPLVAVWPPRVASTVGQAWGLVESYEEIDDLTMTEDEMRDLLQKRARTARLRGKGVDELIVRSSGRPGVYWPPKGQKRSTIELKTGRNVRETLFTLCHELGHFWSYATNRRTEVYDQVLIPQQIWEKDIELKVRNAEGMMNYASPAAAPPELYQKAFDAALLAKPPRLSEDQRREILAEEVRAWCFGFEIVKALGISDLDAFRVHANTALGYYYQRLVLPPDDWTPTSSCECRITSEDQRYIFELVSPEGGAEADESA